MHEIFQGEGLDPEKMEKIRPNIKGPKWTCIHRIDIKKRRKDAIENIEEYEGKQVIYSDGSCREGRVGAAVVYWDNRGRKHA